MKTKVAVRNLRLCTKDCLCLYVCPVGATDTENSIIDTEKCLGCGICAEACPSKAISMVPIEYPPQQPKADAVVAASFDLAESKADEELAARALAANAEADGLKCLATAVARATRLVNEDLLREAGYMLPQSGNAHALLEELAAHPLSADFPVEAATKLLELVPDNDAPEATPDAADAEHPAPDAPAPADAPAADNAPAAAHAPAPAEAAPAAGTTTYRCLLCGAVFDVEDGVEPVCPMCGARGEFLEAI